VNRERLKAQFCAILELNTNAQRMSLLSNLLRSLLAAIGRDCHSLLQSHRESRYPPCPPILVIFGSFLRGGFNFALNKVVLPCIGTKLFRHGDAKGKVQQHDEDVE